MRVLGSARIPIVFLPEDCVQDALKLFPIGTTVAKESDSEIIRGQVYDYRAPYGRVQYEDNDWEELSRQEVHRVAGGTQPPTPPRR